MREGCIGVWDLTMRRARGAILSLYISFLGDRRRRFVAVYIYNIKKQKMSRRSRTYAPGTMDARRAALAMHHALVLFFIFSKRVYCMMYLFLKTLLLRYFHISQVTRMSDMTFLYSHCALITFFLLPFVNCGCQQPLGRLQACQAYPSRDYIPNT